MAVLLRRRDGAFVPAQQARDVQRHSTMSDDRSHEVVRELLHAVDGIALGADPETLIISYVTDPATRLGWPMEAWLSPRFWNEILHPADAMSTAALFRATSRDGLDRRGVHRIRTSSGEDRWFSTRIRAMRARDGTVEKLVALMTDITEPRGIDAFVRERDTYRSLLEQLPGTVYTTDRTLRITGGAGSSLPKLGVKPGQLVGVTLAEYLQTDDPNHPVLGFHRRALAGEIVTYDFEVHGIVFETCVGPLRDEEGAIIGTLGVAREVTELRRIAAERAEQEERFQKLAEVSFEAVVFHEHGKIVLANETFARLFGLARVEDAIGRDVLDFAAPESRDLVENHVRAASEEPYDGVGIRADGTRFEAMVHSRNTHYRNRAVRVTSIRDISARKRIEEQFRHRAAEWEAVLRSIADGVVVFDREGNVKFVNEAGARAVGVPAVPGETPVQLRERMLQLRRDDGSRFTDGDELSGRVLRGDTVGPVDVAYMSSSGRRRVARVTGSPIDVGGDRIGGVLVAHDITRLKSYLAERELLLREATDHASEMQGVLDQLVDGVIVLGLEGAIELANREARMLLGLPTTAKTLADLPSLGKAPARPHVVVSVYQRALAGEVVRNVQIHQGEIARAFRAVRISAGPIRDARGVISGVVLVVRDVTESAEFEEMKDQFIRVAAHELKTPVAVMKGYAQLLLRDGEGGSRAQLQAIERGANRIDRVVQELLDISQLRIGMLTLTPELFDLGDLVATVVANVGRTTIHHVRIIDTARARVRGDRHRLEFVLANLIDNAIRYSPRGGDVEVSLTVNDNFADVFVRDHGVGIPKNRQSRIFERFYRAHTGTPYDFGGIGVALSLSREIIERHGGTMTFESVEGDGSTFRFRIPLGGKDGASKPH